MSASKFSPTLVLGGIAVCGLVLVAVMTRYSYVQGPNGVIVKHDRWTGNTATLDRSNRWNEPTERSAAQTKASDAIAFGFATSTPEWLPKDVLERGFAFNGSIDYVQVPRIGLRCPGEAIDRRAAYDRLMSPDQCTRIGVSVHNSSKWKIDSVRLSSEGRLYDFARRDSLGISKLTVDPDEVAVLLCDECEHATPTAEWTLVGVKGHRPPN